MIQKLRRRFTLLVWITLFIIMVGVVVTVNVTNWQSLVSQAESALDTLVTQNGNRPSQSQPREPAGQQDTEDGMAKNPPLEEEKGTDSEGGPASPKGSPAPGQTPGDMGQDHNALQPPEEKPQNRDASQSLGQISASVSNYYSVQIGNDGSLSWNSDRADLYTDDAVEAFTAQVLASGSESGQIGNEFYRLLTGQDGKLLIVLNMQLEILNAQILRRNTILIGLATWLLMGVGAFFLIRRLIQPVQEAFDRQQQFVWDASHELKTPLAVISANADALSRDVGESEWLTYIHDEINRASRMINSMLTLAQIDQGAVQAQMKPFDLSRCVTGILLPFESVIFEAGQTLVSEIPEGIQCTGDEAMIGQLLSILLGNAVKYAGKGGIITVRLALSGRCRALTVHNTGEGISPRDQAHLFERFYRADASHNSGVEGSGLGLAIAKALTDVHRGRIAVSSPPEGGTLFTVLLP